MSNLTLPEALLQIEELKNALRKIRERLEDGDYYPYIHQIVKEQLAKK